jgi:hypothetical protein
MYSRLEVRRRNRMRFPVTNVGAVARRAQGLFHSHTVTIGGSEASNQQPEAPTATNIVELVYELLDAHADTSDLAAGLSYNANWAAHLEYLRALQRTGREILARRSVEALG